VSFISPASGVPDGQRVAAHLVRIDLAGDELGRVKPGMAGQAEVVGGQDGALALPLKEARQSISRP
jgi:hypothetical protein